MSHHRYPDVEREVLVLIGWERVRPNLLTGEPVGGGFFMVVYDAEHSERTSDAPAFSNLYQYDSYPTELAGYLQHLEDRWGVTLPGDLLARLEDDRRNDA